jgi:hypothetical protein
MKVRTLIACLLAASVSCSALDLTRAGFTAASTAQSGGLTVAAFQDPRGRPVQVIYSAEPSDAVVNELVAEWKIVDSFKTIVVQSLRFTIDDSTIGLLLTPSRLTVQGTDLLPTVPAGLYFAYAQFFEYDFRMTAENIFPRIRGPYTSEDDLVGKMLAAYKDPQAVLQASDPAYFYAKVDQLEKSVATLETKVGELSASLSSLSTAHQELVDAHAELSRKYDALEAAGSEIAQTNTREHQEMSASIDSLAASVDSLDRKEAELAQGEAELAAADQRLAAADADLAGRTDQLARQNADAASEFEALRQATLYFQNIEWLFFHKEIPREGIARIVELKKANPEMTQKDISAQLKGEGITITDKAIKLVLEVYFNQF